MPQSFFVSCPHYLEGLLMEEIRALSPGADEGAAAKETQGGVSFSGSLERAYRLCLSSRIAGRVLLRLATGSAEDAPALYRLARTVPWSDHFSPERTFAVDSHVRHRQFGNPGFAALTVKDAVVDSFRDAGHPRPSVDTGSPDVRLFLYLTHREASLYFDLSGESLHRRGYRKRTTEAPLRENTAAAVLFRAGWPHAVDQWRRGGEPPFLADPLCGSGTICIEAALIATDAAPGLLREGYGHSFWKQGEPSLWKELIAEARDRRDRGMHDWVAAGGRLWASDVDGSAVESARENARRAGVEEIIDFGSVDFRRLTRGAVLGRLNRTFGESTAPPYLIVTNPPYGVRLTAEEDPNRLYQELGRWMVSTFPGISAAVLAESKQQARHLGLRAERINVLYNGNLKVYLAFLRLTEDNRYQAPEEESPELISLRNRLGKNLKALRGYLEQEQISCFRLYDADIPQYAAAVDVYEEVGGGSWAVLQEYAAPKTVDRSAAARRLEDLQTAVVSFLELPEGQLIAKRRRRQRGPDKYTPSREGKGVVLTVTEDELLFEVNLTDYIDTGLFPDGRILRSMVAAEAPGRRFLNLFSYTCSASVYAAAEGAHTTSVDTSNTYLSWGRRNFELNGLEPSKHRFVREDCLEFLKLTKERFDVILVDPPTFSNRKGRETDFDVQRDHEELLRRAADLLEPGGSLFFSTNYRRFALEESLSRDFSVSDISEEVLPPDYRRRKRFRSTWRLVSPLQRQ